MDKSNTWALVVDPKEPGKSLILYKGEPIADVQIGRAHV